MDEPTREEILAQIEELRRDERPVVFWVLVAITILVFVHEMGHFLAAKLFNMKVERFSVGFPPKVFGKQIGETEYVIGATPLGGYVRIAGMVDESLDTDNLHSEPGPREFRAKPVWQRIVVITAGVIFNILLAVAIFAGLKLAYGETYVPAENVEAVYVEDGSIAHEMGLRTGDRLVAVVAEGCREVLDELRTRILRAEDVVDELLDLAGERLGRGQEPIEDGILVVRDGRIHCVGESGACDVPESADPSLGWLGIYVRGLCMGTADAIPGVSGGTIAMIVGIYERLIAAVTSIDPGRVLRVLRGLVSDGRADAWAAVREMDALFLLALGAGIATAIVTVTRIAHWAITEVPVATFGFIGASALVLYTEVGLDTWPERIAALAGVVLAFVVSGRAATALESSPALTFFAGALAVSAMILPGISGSLLLVLIGQYEFMTGELQAFVDGLLGLVTGGSLDTVLSAGVTVVAFVAGAVVGLFTVAHAVRKALATYREPTLAFLVSLIAGALRALWPWQPWRLLTVKESSPLSSFWRMTAPFY